MQKDILQRFETFFIDADGVLWEGNRLYPLVRETLSSLENQGKRLFYVSNNSSSSVQMYVEKFNKLGIHAGPEQIMISTIVALEYIKKCKGVENIYIIGEEGLKATFKNAGYHVLPDNPGRDEIDAIDAVIVGLDRSITYMKLSIAIRAILNKARFIATNLDPLFPTEEGVTAGTSAIVHALIKATGMNPEMVCGKPEKVMADLLISRNGLDRNAIVMIGDRVTSDMEFARNAGIQGILVQTGFGAEESKLFPDFPYYKVLESIADIIF